MAVYKDKNRGTSLTEALGYPEPDKIEITLSKIMEWVLNEEEFDLSEGIIHHKEEIDLMPANIELSGVETSLVGIMSSETVLKEYIELIRDDYDYILVDCSPNLGQLTLNALVAADEIIIPVQAAYLPLKGLEQLLKTISRVRRKMNPTLNIMGTLGLGIHEPLKQRIVMNYNLEGLTKEEGHNYITEKLKGAGCNQTVFEDAAMEAILNAADGTPRMINKYCNQSMLIGDSNKANLILPLL